MTDSAAPAGKAREPSKEDIIASARKDLESSRELSRRTAKLNGEQPGQPPTQRMGVTVDLGHKHLTSLPEEVIDIVKDEIERLAISHNEVSFFPPKLAECRRLRYLNARFNRLPEFPKPVLQLASLEILDLAKNELWSLPDEIQNLTSLKVLAVQRNKIERLPTCLGGMSRLLVLLVEENPLVFPPYELCVVEGDRATKGEKEIFVTNRIKKYLAENAGSAKSTRPDSDGDMSEGNAETPRPVRPSGTRFPVRPSLGSAEAVNTQSTSPDPPPPIPNRNHERMKSTNSNTRKQYLLSPPTATATANGLEPGNDVTVRTKRHGMITPRGPEGAAQALALSPTTLQDAFSNIGSRPPSRGSGISSASLSAESIFDVASLVYKVILALAKQANDMRQTMDAQNTLKQHIELELRTASNRSDILIRCLRRAQTELSKPNANRPGYLFRPVIDCLGSISQLARLLSSNSPMLCRAIDHERYRSMFWDMHRDGWELFIANTRMSSAVKSVNHSRHTSSSSQFRLPYHSAESSRSIPMTSIFDPRSNSRNGPSPSTMLDQTLGPPFGFSPFNPGAKPPYSRPVQMLGPDGTYTMREEDVRTEMSYDPIWETVYMSLRELCEKANEGLPKIQSIFNAERQKSLRTAEPDSEIIRHLASLIGRGNTLLDTAQALAKRLNEMSINDRKIRHDLEFWQLCRNIIVDWTGYVNKLKSLTSYSSTPQAETKSTMKLIHNAVKDASARIQYSPWGHYLSQSNEDQTEAQTTLRNRPLPSAGILPNPAVGAMLPPPNPTGINLTATNNTTAPPMTAVAITAAGGVGSVPSTPLSAALGPAAIATLPNKDLGQIGQTGTTRSINFFERADRLAATMSKRQPEVLYGKKMA